MAVRTKSNRITNGQGPIVVPEKSERVLEVPAPRFEYIAFLIEGTSPYCHNQMSEKAINQMKAAQEAGSTGKSKKKREAKDFTAAYENAKHIAKEGWIGIPATAFRAAMISACRCCGVVMTKAKLAVFVEADGYDRRSFDPLVKITKGEPEMVISPLRNDNGSMDLRPRPVWQPGWQAEVRIKYDADMISATDVANLMLRVGIQVGIGEGRHDSKKCVGIAWGCFKILNQET